MKTSTTARTVLKLRSIMFCLAFVGMVAISFEAGKALGSKTGSYSAPQVGATFTPSVSFADLMASMR